MNNILNSIIVIVVLCGIVAGGYFGYNYAYQRGVKSVKKVVQIDTVRVPIERQILKIVPKYSYVDRVTKEYVKIPINADSIYQAALTFWQSQQTDTTDYLGQYNYAAEMDTTFENDELGLNVKFISPLPLSQYSFFDLSYKMNQKTKVVTIIEKKDWAVGIQAGIGLASSGISAYIGVGFSYNIWSF